MADWTFLTCAMRTLPSSYQEVVPNSSVLKSRRAANRMWRKLCSLTLELGLQNDDTFALWTWTDMSKVLAAWSHHSVRKPRVWSATSAEVSASTTSHLSDGSRDSSSRLSSNHQPTNLPNWGPGCYGAETSHPTITYSNSWLIESIHIIKWLF